MTFLLWFLFDPQKEIFVIPIIGLPVVWYSLLFALGFILGYYIFRHLLKRYFSFFPKLIQTDITDLSRLKTLLAEKPENENQKKISALYQSYCKKNHPNSSVLNFLNDLIEKPQTMKEVFDTVWTGQKELSMQVRSFLEKVYFKCIASLYEKANQLSDKLFAYLILSTILGARLGHILFYEDWKFYFSNPLRILKTWEGGLASHGAAITILLAIALFCYVSRKSYPKVTWLKILDLVSVPACLCGACIRIGNFINQEILGTTSDLPWAVIFARPADGSFPAPRHPVQLYEAFFYLSLFAVLYLLQGKKYFLLRKGKSIGLFLMLVFGFRFFIEFLKEKQSILIDADATLLMGQYLSIPFVLIGVFLFLQDRIFLKKRI